MVIIVIKLMIVTINNPRRLIYIYQGAVYRYNITGSLRYFKCYRLANHYNSAIKPLQQPVLLQYQALTDTIY